MIGKKKKLIVPLVAIMMCTVALAGVAYAYTSTVTVNSNTVDVDTGEFVLHVYGKKVDGNYTELTTGITLQQLLVVTTDYVVNTPLVTASVTAANSSYIGKIDITRSNISDTMANLSCSDIDDFVINDVTNQSGGSVTISVDVKFYSAEECTGGEITSVDVTSGTATVYYKITVSTSGSITFANRTPLTDANNVITKLVDKNFNLVFTATSASAA